MVTFFISIGLLVLGYMFYGRFITKVFQPDDSKLTPAYMKADGIDYVPMDSTRNSFIQLLNIAGVGPIFGPILGALYGPIAFIWIVIGSIFAGAVHDYLIGMISLRAGGAHLPALASKYLGKNFTHIVNLFTVLLLVLVGTVFISAPAEMISDLLGIDSKWFAVIALIIFGYYIIATVLPIDRIIGRVYPILGVLLLLSTIGVGVSIFLSDNTIPELTIHNLHPKDIPFYPVIFLTISCGALSGFHATQSPIISRTIKREKDGRKIFYGMMIVEAIIAMVWATAAMTLFYGEDLGQLLESGGAPAVVNKIATMFLGGIGGTIAILGVIVLPITSGDTSFRAARMIIADYVKIDQVSLKNRFLIAIPIFITAFLLTKIDFEILWRYFSWANQAIAAIALWVSSIYLYRKGTYYMITLIPAFFISSVLISYLLFDSNIGFNLNIFSSDLIGIIGALIITILFYKSCLSKQEIDNT